MTRVGKNSIFEINRDPCCVCHWTILREFFPLICLLPGSFRSGRSLSLGLSSSSVLPSPPSSSIPMKMALMEFPTFRSCFVSFQCSVKTCFDPGLRQHNSPCQPQHQPHHRARGGFWRTLLRSHEISCLKSLERRLILILHINALQRS